MAARQRQRRPSRSHASDAVQTSQTPSQATAGGLNARSYGGWRLSLVFAGVLLGIAMGVVVTRIYAATRVVPEKTADGLLVTQQLDSLFRVVESQLKEDPSRVTAYKKLLDTFLAYDRQFVEEANIHPDTQLARAYAARRMGRCSQMVGQLEESYEHYCQSRDLFAARLQADPNVVELYSLLLNTHTQIVDVQLARGEFGSAEKEYRAALRLLRESTLVPDFEYHSAILPELKSLAQLGIELRLFADAMEAADRFAFSANVVLERAPDDVDLMQEAEDANQLLSTLSTLLKQQANQ